MTCEVQLLCDMMLHSAAASYRMKHQIRVQWFYLNAQFVAQVVCLAITVLTDKKKKGTLILEEIKQ